MIKRLFYDFIGNIVGLMIIFWLLPDIYIDPTLVNTGDKLKIIILAGVVLGLINTFIKPILKIISFPIAIITLGLFYFVLNAFILGFVAWMIPEIQIDSLLALLIAAFLLSILNNLVHKILQK